MISRALARTVVLALVLGALGASGCAPRTPPSAPGASTAPGYASLGESALARRDYRAASTAFAAALAIDPRYRPALVGAVDAALGAGDDVAAMAALYALLAVVPDHADARGRLDVVRLRVSQSELALAERFRAAGQLDDAERHLANALAATPENSPVLRALASVQLARGALDAAESRARQAIALDPADAASHAVLGDILEAQGRYREAAAAYVRVVALDPRPVWNERRAGLQQRAVAATLPENYRLIASTPAVTRAQVAAALGVRLSSLLARAPARVADVVTDARGNWAAEWILPVVRAGWIDALPNHTFQPGAKIQRAELARVVVAVLSAAAAVKGKTLESYGAARGAFADVPGDHTAYRVIAIAVSAGIMTVDANRFHPEAVVSGTELLTTIARLEPLAK